MLYKTYYYHPNDRSKIHQLNKAIKNYEIDIVMLCEVNTKQNTVNISRIERKMKQIHRAAQVIEADTGEHTVTNNDYLPGGLLNVIFNKCGPLVQKNKIRKGK